MTTDESEHADIDTRWRHGEAPAQPHPPCTSLACRAALGLAQCAAGRVLLHLFAMAGDHRVGFHGAGILRELHWRIAHGQAVPALRQSPPPAGGIARAGRPHP